jgi:hypothetical protein
MGSVDIGVAHGAEAEAREPRASWRGSGLGGQLVLFEDEDEDEERERAIRESPGRAAGSGT